MGKALKTIRLKLFALPDLSLPANYIYVIPLCIRGVGLLNQLNNNFNITEMLKNCTQAGFLIRLFNRLEFNSPPLVANNKIKKSIDTQSTCGGVVHCFNLNKKITLQQTR
jgi:hypothetical protein